MFYRAKEIEETDARDLGLKFDGETGHRLQRAISTFVSVVARLYVVYAKQEGMGERSWDEDIDRVPFPTKEQRFLEIDLKAYI